MKIAMSAAHGGFGSEQVPLGGGAAVFERLLATPAFRDSELHLLGAGPQVPAFGFYSQLAYPGKNPSELGMLEYARFCEEFGKASTERLLELKPDVVLCHDVSEGPDVSVLAKAGLRVATIFHVDVVDIFNRLYLKNCLSPQKLASGYRRLRSLPWPGLLKLIFEKQQALAEWGALSIVPSYGAQELLSQCYPDSKVPIIKVGWGAPQAIFERLAIQDESERLRAAHKIPNHHRVLLTLSRLSPEKAQHRLLQAALFAEEEGRMPSDLTIVIAGAPAFMEGKRHAERLHRLARKLRTRVLFPGHVGGLEKAAWYRMACLFVVNSLHESYGLTTLEAMQQGCPVVALKSFGTADTVAEDVGRLVLPGPALEQRLWGTLELLLRPDSSEQLQQMSARAEATAARQTFHEAAQKVFRALEKLHKD